MPGKPTELRPAGVRYVSVASYPCRLAASQTGLVTTGSLGGSVGDGLCIDLRRSRTTAACMGSTTGAGWGWGGCSAAAGCWGAASGAGATGAGATGSIGRGAMGLADDAGRGLHLLLSDLCKGDVPC
jgi:hypothetical protein